MKSLRTLILLSTVILLASCDDTQGVTQSTPYYNDYPFIHKGHSYIMFGTGTMSSTVHDPDCHCLQKESNSLEL